MVIATPTPEQASNRTQISSLAQVNDNGDFISMGTATPVVMVTESTLHSIPHCSESVTTPYQDSQLSAQDNQHYGPPQLSPMENQHIEQYTAKAPSPQIPVSAEAPQSEAVSMETSQNLPVSMVAVSDDTKDPVPSQDNSLKATQQEQSVQDYNVQTQCGETAANEPISVSLMFENGQQLNEEESSGVSHTNTVTTVNVTPAVLN